MASLVVNEKTSPITDAEALHKACKGWGTDEKSIIKIIGHRNAAQRKLIIKAYEDTYQEELIKRLESELSGDFERAVYRWILDPADRDAVLAHVALKKTSPDHHVITEIACTRSSEELLSVRRAYQIRYKHSLEEDVAAHTSGDIRKLLVALVSSFRYEGSDINARVAKKEADVLHNAIKEKKYCDEEIIRIVSTRSKTQLMATFNHFRDAHNTSVTKTLLGDSSDKFLIALRTAVRCINDPKKYFEKVLRNATNRVGTDEDALTRVIVTRAERDLKEIKEVYYKRNSVSLDDAVAKDTSGDYEHFLLTLLGKEDY